MPSFADMKNMYKLQKEAKRVQKELDSIHIEAEGDGVKVVVSAKQEIISIEIQPGLDHQHLEKTLLDALNRALKKAQIVGAEKMQGVMGQMGIGG